MSKRYQISRVAATGDSFLYYPEEGDFKEQLNTPWYKKKPKPVFTWGKYYCKPYPRQLRGDFGDPRTADIFSDEEMKQLLCADFRVVVFYNEHDAHQFLLTRAAYNKEIEDLDFELATALFGGYEEVIAMDPVKELQDNRKAREAYQQSTTVFDNNSKPLNMTSNDIAKVAHEVNRAYCTAIGDNTQKPYEDAPDWQKESAIKGVDFKLANPDATPEMMHKSWLAEKAAAGWTHGPIKDADRKQHPCFMEYEHLPVAQRVKDYLFASVVTSLKPFLVTEPVAAPAPQPEPEPPVAAEGEKPEPAANFGSFI